MTEIHSFDKLSVTSPTKGDYYVEHDESQNFRVILILSSSGSDEHEAYAEWIESNDRTQEDFLNM